MKRADAVRVQELGYIPKGMTGRDWIGLRADAETAIDRAQWFGDEGCGQGDTVLLHVQITVAGVGHFLLEQVLWPMGTHSDHWRYYNDMPFNIVDSNGVQLLQVSPDVMEVM